MRMKGQNLRSYCRRRDAGVPTAISDECSKKRDEVETWPRGEANEPGSRQFVLVDFDQYGLATL
jgi:hypothetical protein